MILRDAYTRQTGAVLFVGLIMLILITLLSVSAMRLANVNLLAVGNEQYQKEAEDAANYHLDLALNANDFTSRNVDRSAQLPAFAGATARDATSYTVKIPPPDCKRYRYLKKSELVDATNSVPLENLACFGGSSGSAITIVTSSLNENSLCATSLWEMTADVELPDTGARTRVVQGVEMRISHAEAEDQCK
ncbi:hypothetical protein [Aromatoleum sp.]|uniref:hypothetical protein n=1 Tax=Aromatoleum sp. TaxID=2307007 RepID=UPI002FCB5716